MKNEIIRLPGGWLHIFKQPNYENHFYRFFVNGKYFPHITKTSNLSFAKSTAETNYDSYRFNNLAFGGRFSYSWNDAEETVLTSLALGKASRGSPAKTYNMKLGVLRKFLGAMPLEQITDGAVKVCVDNFSESAFHHPKQAVIELTLRII